MTRDIEYFDRIIEKNPLDATAHYSRGLAHLALGNYVKANLDVEKSFILGLNTTEVRTALGYTRLKVNMVPNAWTVRNELAEWQIGIGLYDKALANLERSLDITGLSTESPPALLLKGRALRGLDRFDEALATLKQGVLIGG